MIKRYFDFFLAITGIFIFLPLECIVILILFLENKRKVFYFQERAGKNGKNFRLIKFLTMQNNKVTSLFCQLLRYTALDELPQLLNIAKGDMSFVGPRPLMIEELAGMETDKFFIERIKVRPGLTGVAQLLLNKNDSVDRKFFFDLWYINNRTLFMDVKIILVSFLVTLLGRWEINTEKLNFLRNLKRIINNSVTFNKKDIH
jgi:lipopolysaccharide/colanic/teichoic acid biosynthesis glycosyltransferase